MIVHLSHWTRWATTTSYPYGQNRRRLGPKRNRRGPTTWPPSTPGSLHSQVWHCLVPANWRIKNQKNQPATDFISWLGWRENIATVAWSCAPTMHVLAFEAPWRADRHGVISPCDDLYASRADHEELVPRAVVAAAPGVCTDEGFPKRSALDASSGP